MQLSDTDYAWLDYAQDLMRVRQEHPEYWCEPEVSSPTEGEMEAEAEIEEYESADLETDDDNPDRR